MFFAQVLKSQEMHFLRVAEGYPQRGFHQSYHPSAQEFWCQSHPYIFHLGRMQSVERQKRYSYSRVCVQKNFYGSVTLLMIMERKLNSITYSASCWTGVWKGKLPFEIAWQCPIVEDNKAVAWNIALRNMIWWLFRKQRVRLSLLMQNGQCFQNIRIDLSVEMLDS